MAGNGGLSSTPRHVVHLARRFFGAVRPGPPSPEDERWACAHLLEGEREIWQRMNNPDRRHAVAVARATAWELATSDVSHPMRPIMAAALLHDSGKVLGDLRTPGRVFATLFWSLADDGLADRWLERSDRDMKAKLAMYRRHPELGADMLAAAGSDPFTSAWAREHHLPAHKWSLPHEVARVLKDCDDD